MKRYSIAAVLLCAVLLLAALPLPTSAEGSALIVGDTAGRRGETVGITVSLREVMGIASGGFNVVYDSSSLVLISAEAGSALDGTSTVVNPSYSGNSVRVTFAGAEMLSHAGDVLVLQFRIKNNAAFGKHEVSLSSVKLMNVNSQVVVSSGTAGGVSVRSVSLALSSAACIAGQDAQLDVELIGDLLPSGGEFELHYDPTYLTNAAVRKEATVGGTSITLLANVDAANGTIRISWASANPISRMGKLCSVLFTTDCGASGAVEVTFANVHFYDESGSAAELNTCSNGTITFEQAAPAAPMIYLLGGQRDTDGNATVRIIADGANSVCGGSMTLNFDASLCVPVGVLAKSSSLTTNPEDVLYSNGRIVLAWAHPSPPQEAECLIEIKFAMQSSAASALLISGVELTDQNGNAVPANVYEGKIGINSPVQMTAVSLSDDSVLSGYVLDAAGSGESQTVEIKAILAFYRNGQMLGVQMSETPLSLAETGIAAFRFGLSVPAGTNQLRLFVVQSNGSFVPMCEGYELQLAA